MLSFYAVYSYIDLHRLKWKLHSLFGDLFSNQQFYPLNAYIITTLPPVIIAFPLFIPISSYVINHLLHHLYLRIFTSNCLITLWI